MPEGFFLFKNDYICMGLIDLTKVESKQAQCVLIDGVSYEIQTSFRYGLMFYRLMAEKKYMSEFMFLYKFEKPKDLVKGFEALDDFYCKKTEFPKETGSNDGEKVFDYTADSDLIYSAFLQCYGINLLNADMHWYEFRALVAGLKDCKLTDVIGYRSFNPYDRTKYETTMARLRDAWSLDDELTDDEQDKLDAFNALF